MSWAIIALCTFSIIDCMRMNKLDNRIKRLEKLVAKQVEGEA